MIVYIIERENASSRYGMKFEMNLEEFSSDLLISPTPGLDSRTVQPVAQSLYRLSYLAHEEENVNVI